MSQFWSDLVHQLTPYVPGEQPKITNIVKLNTNENPYPPSPKVIEAINQANNQDLALYPDPNATELKKSIADFYSMKIEQVFVGNGSDEVLAHAFQALLKKDSPLRFPDISYSFYPVYCELYQIEQKTIPLDQDFKINPTDYNVDSGAIIFPNPNAPTGRALSLSEIEEILNYNMDSVVIVDEAYINFGGETAISLVNQYPNLLVVQTFSKSRSLAGLRIGFAIGNADLITGLEIVKNSFNSYPMDRLAIAAGIAAIQDKEYFEKTCKAIINTRHQLTRFLQDNGFEVIPSSANFVFAKHNLIPAETLGKKLREKNIIVRYFNKPRISDFLRITIGTDEQNQLLCNAILAIIKENNETQK
jgi:histidinol-phosphate aminotransferase